MFTSRYSCHDTSSFTEHIPLVKMHLLLEHKKVISNLDVYTHYWLYCTSQQCSVIINIWQRNGQIDHNVYQSFT